MNWDEKAEDYAGAHHTYEHLGYGENMLFHKKFVEGARWQREQLRTDEALEPWAHAIYDAVTAKDPWPHSWETADEFARGAAFSRARGIMNALLGEEA